MSGDEVPDIDPDDGKAVGDEMERVIQGIYPHGIKTARIERALYLGVLYLVRTLSRTHS